jgi:hypothetical protein
MSTRGWISGTTERRTCRAVDDGMTVRGAMPEFLRLARLRRAFLAAILVSSLVVLETFAQIPEAPGDEGVAPRDEEPDGGSAAAWPPSAFPTARHSRAAEIVDMMHKAMRRGPKPAAKGTPGASSQAPLRPRF